MSLEMVEEVASVNIPQQRVLAIMMGPRAMDSRMANLSHRKSTKQLISRYESMTAPKSSIPPIPPQKPTLSPPTTQSYFATKKEKTSIRQSFRNLVGLFKKGDSKFKINSVFSTKQPSFSFKGSALLSRSTTPATQICMSGTLLYMARLSDEGSSILPVWAESSVSLQIPYLLISSLSINGHPDTHSILLNDVSDVRSLTPQQFESEQLVLLPKDYDLDDLRFFEILFDGKATERFAVTSVHERADWVTSIWDAVLSCRGGRRLPVLDLKPELDCTSSTSASYISQRVLPSVPPSANDVPIPASRPSSIHSSDLAKTGPVPQTRFSAELGSITAKPPDPKTTSHISTNKPLPLLVPAPQDASTWSATGSIVEAYGEMGHGEEYPLRDDTLLRNEMQKLIGGINNLERGVIEGLGKMEARIDGVYMRMNRTDAALDNISIDVALAAKSMIPSSQQPPPLDPAHIDHISNSVQTLQIVSRELRSLVEALENSQAVCLEALKNEQPGVLPAQALIPQPSTEPTNLDPLFERLGNIENVLVNSGIQIQEITKISKEEAEQRNVQEQQQTDSVRYLNELNSWLESFVNNGAAQIRFMHGSVEHIHNKLGCDLPDATQTPPIAILLREIKDRVDSLHKSLVTSLNTTQRNSSNAPEQIADMIAQQNRNQEALFRGLTAELTSEIRGERIRFVDAMKEATEINVQSHVEEFKRELKREVHGMTKEVGRLYKERQTMENEIAELFAFYSKQKQGIIPFATAGGPCQIQHPGPQGMSSQNLYGRGRPHSQSNRTNY